MELAWKWYSFAELSATELYAILKLRQQVFIVEQQCVYLDSDGLDQNSHHLVGWENQEEKDKPVAYLRTLPIKKQGEFPSIGRVLIHHKYRKNGIGREIMKRGLNHLEKLYPGVPVRISAQQYLTNFYERLGFVVSSDSYDEDGIPHIEMIRSPDVSERV